SARGPRPAQAGIATMRWLAVCGMIGLLATGCGRGERTSRAAAAPTPLGRGGTLKLIASSDVDFIDPGQTYFTSTYGLFRVIARTLMQYPPAGRSESLTPAPDL